MKKRNEPIYMRDDAGNTFYRSALLSRFYVSYKKEKRKKRVLKVENAS